MTFDPFIRVNAKYGAPMGRHGDNFDQLADWCERPLYIQHCGGDGFYDRGGAYWGHSHVFAVYPADGELCAYIEAPSPSAAIAMVHEVAPEAEIHFQQRGAKLEAGR
ncbi:MAG TPA: hypothetical protein VNS02_05065 [Rhizobiaceae bacterium]|nr:hypothetical protein [Rhizobiaceae bacterium]